VAHAWISPHNNITASVAACIYALDAVAKYAASGDRVIFGREAGPGECEVWTAVQILVIFFAMLLTSTTYAFALKSLRPSKERPPDENPPLPASKNDVGRFVEVSATADDVELGRRVGRPPRAKSRRCAL
jgi:hypothetical protein